MHSQIGILPLEKPLLEQALERGSPAVEYLWSYLDGLRGTAFIHEPHYVDRHYLDDFAGYYARSFRAPPSHCARLHFFGDLALPALMALVRQAYEPGGRESAERALQEHYLGFVVKRPLRGAMVGRTVLRTYDADRGRRHYTVVRPYRVHLAGLRLRVDGLAYQQQDGGAAVCASTALWSALQKVAHTAGHRTPTPSEVTEAANSPFAARDGLVFHQMATALANLGYLAETFAPADNRDLFRAQLVAALESHLPVVLLVYQRERVGRGVVTTGHAVTVTGYSEPGSIVPITMRGLHGERLPMRGGGVVTVYVHDDNLGSHAHYELVDSSTLTDSDGHPRLLLRRGRAHGARVPGWSVDEWEIDSALVPKPDKLRMPVAQLLQKTHALKHALAEIGANESLHFGARFQTGVEYRNELFRLGFPGVALTSLQLSISLPRFVGVITAHNAQGPLCEFVIDVSAAERPGQGNTIIACVAPGVSAGEQLGANVAMFCQKRNVPFLLRT